MYNWPRFTSRATFYVNFFLCREYVTSSFSLFLFFSFLFLFPFREIIYQRDRKSFGVFDFKSKNDRKRKIPIDKVLEFTKATSIPMNDSSKK